MAAEQRYGILSDLRILERYNNGEIIISPFDEENLKTSSIDVRLGEYYFRPNRHHNLSYFDPWDEEHVREIYGEPQIACTAGEMFGDDLPSNSIKPDQKIILAFPGQIILCHTEEYIGGVSETTTMMKARSSVGRCDIVTCNCAGWGDVGYFSRWTMEIKTDGFGVGLPVILRVGESIAQIVFSDTGPTRQAVYSNNGKYQNTADLEELKRNWNPQMMLPKLWKDKRIGR